MVGVVGDSRAPSAGGTRMQTVQLLNLVPVSTGRSTTNINRAICQFGHPVHEGFQFGTGAPRKVASLVQVALAKLPVWSV